MSNHGFGLMNLIRIQTALVAGMLMLATSLRAADAPIARLDEKHREFFKSYCVSCHNGEKQEGKLRLDDIGFVINSIESADRWQKILNQLNSGDMPPEDAQQPDRSAKTEFLDELAKLLVTARRTLNDGGGTISMRRLNRREYKNTIRDLLGVDINVRELPADGGAGTFDTVGSSLFMSSDQFEQYLALGRQAIDESFARYAPSQPVRRMHVEVEEKNAKIAKGLEQRLDARDRYVKWTAAVDDAAKKPENADVVAAIRAEKKGNDTHLYSAWKRVPGAPSPADFKFVDDVEADHQGRRDWLHYVPYHRSYLEQPGIKTGTYLSIEDVWINPYQPFRLPGDWPVGDYVVRVRIAATENTPAARHFVEFGSQHDSGVRAVASAHQVTGTLSKPQVLEIPIKFSPANGLGFFFQEKGTFESEGDARRVFSDAKQRNGVGPEFALWLDWIEVESVDGQTTSPLGNASPNNSSTSSSVTIKQRREVELHANAMVGGTYNGYFKGGYEAAKKFLETGEPQKGIPDEQEAKFRVKVFEEHGPTFRRYLDDPLTKTGAYLTIFNVHPEEVITLPPDQPSGWLKTKHEIENAPSGEYVLRFRIGAVKGTPKERHFVTLGSRMKPGEKEDFTLLQTFQISGTTDEPQVIEVPVSIIAGGPRSFVLREKRDVKLDHEIYTVARKETGVGPVSALWIDWVEWEGPRNKTVERTQLEPVLFANSQELSERDHARAILERFALRAFRDSQPKPEYIAKLVKLFETRQQAGDKFDVAIREPLSVILASPRFLYLSEPTSFVSSVPLVPSKGDGTQATKGTNENAGVNSKSLRGSRSKLTPREVAVRLSYFLWSAPPDEELLALARSGNLQKPEVLAAEVDRLLSHDKSREFVQGFVPQWLSMERLDFFQFNTQLYRDFDESMRSAARREVYETIAFLLRENGSVRDLLKSDYVIVNGLLANFYGLEGVSGDEYRKVSLPADSPRGGLLGMSAIMAMGSNGEVSSPVERGAWVLRKLLHDPPPPAPPNVPQLTRLEGKLLTTRERILAHQEQPQCASCHRKIDPIGFGLENFDAVGKWRTEDRYEKKGVGKKGWPIDPAGALHKGPSFKTYFELRDIIASRPEQFSRGLAEALIEYSLGRPYGFNDDALAASIVSRAKEKNFAIRELLLGVIVSEAFQQK